MSIIDDNKDKIKKELKQIIEKDENLLSHAELKNNAKRPHFMKDGIILDLNQEVFNSIHNASKLILEDDYIKKTYSPYHIEKKIREIIVKTFSENKTDRIRYLEEKIETLRNDLKAEVKDWLIRIPIYNLIIDGDIEMGKVKFFTLNESKAEEME
ncbi:MAG: hypothetical protein ISP01_00570 [Methanobrevibacter arboriphilus]|uniref:Uncharacterized protein n=1 Tax=Methanobrevibacter arboriphilus TaxID=39441 RepID=A0A843AB29_METAZ|nr:hypothetical protein [Methanobrevibacter arboriphilus]MBF4467874.1 hypothetical protein [Methanobrevibacter arboriphilus]